jgi:hypothetical protein
MDAIETESVEQDGQTYRITLYPDGDTPSPLDDWSEMGAILSLNRRHGNFDPGGVASAIEHDPDAVPLSYYEHGRCLWSIAGELPAGARCPFDSVPLAGVWLPDAETLASAKDYGGWTRRQFMRKRARQACDAYTQWCNGDIYGFEIARIDICPCCGEEKAEPLESCWGIYGLEECRAEARVNLSSRPDPVASRNRGQGPAGGR